MNGPTMKLKFAPTLVVILAGLLVGTVIGRSAWAQDMGITRGAGVTSVSVQAPLTSTGGLSPTLAGNCAGAGTPGFLCSTATVLTIDGGVVIAAASALTLGAGTNNLTLNGTNPQIRTNAGNLMQFQSSLSAAGASSSTAAFGFYPSTAYDADDLICDFQSNLNVSKWRVDIEGDSFQTGTVSSLIASGSVGVQTLTGAKTCLGTTGIGCMSYETALAGLTTTTSLTLPSVALYLKTDQTKYIFWDGTDIQIGGSSVLRISGNSVGIKLGTVLTWSMIAPTTPVACTSPTITHGGAVSFQVDVGTTCAGISVFSATLPAATNGYDCSARHKTTAASAAAEVVCAGDTTTNTGACTNYSRTLGTALAFTDGDDLVISCTGR